MAAEQLDTFQNLNYRRVLKGAYLVGELLEPQFFTPSHPVSHEDAAVYTWADMSESEQFYNEMGILVSYEHMNYVHFRGPETDEGMTAVKKLSALESFWIE